MNEFNSGIDRHLFLRRTRIMKGPLIGLLILLVSSTCVVAAMFFGIGYLISN